MVKRPGFTTCKTFWALSKPAYIALGSNLGDTAATLQSAFAELQTLSRKPIKQSSLWRSTPVDCPPDSPDFINAAAVLTPLDGETPESLLEKLQALEVQFGRQPKVVMNEPRPLDLISSPSVENNAKRRNSHFRIRVFRNAGLFLSHWPRLHPRRFCRGNPSPSLNCLGT